MELNFCENCNNLMDIYSDEESSKLYLGCKACSFKKDFEEEHKCIYTNESTIELCDIINTNPFLTEDITLPVIKGNPNIKCPNADCICNKDKSVESEIIYIKYDSEKLSYMYICKHCNQKWTNR
jgi:DNA-directed RNA polymerase subunit M/transcription elongation factor TFIIS